jgi:hypothetical protein
MWFRFLVPCVLIISMGTARAQYLPPRNAAESPIIIEPQQFAVTSSFDADSLGVRTAYVEGTFAPYGGIDESGIRVRATVDASWYRFLTTENPRVVGTDHDIEGAVLAGYAISSQRFSITGLVGPAFGDIDRQADRQDVNAYRWGVKAVIEMHATPTDMTMASGWVSYSTIANYLQVEAKTGLRIFEDVYFGPEAKFTWQQILPWQVNFSTNPFLTTTPVSPQTSIATMHLGAHISAANIGPVEIGISGGWAHDQQLGSGYYGSVSFSHPF